mmetsp:Transcript_5295/g.7439  ORF Transcript_5295/g.7439 Transcript_5295/m.7439 type:complete len:1038 (+) Transcript_5295:129-3242(+)
MAQVTVVLPEHILQLLPKTWSESAQERKLAEQHLTQLEKVQGYCVSLLKIVSSNEIHESVRLSASILLKRFVQHFWFDWKKNNDGNDNAQSGSVKLQWTDYVIPEADKTVMLNSIIDGIIHSDPRVKLQLADTLKTIADNEYPDPWGATLIPQLQTLLQSKDLRVLHGAILSIRTIIKKYEYIPASPRRKPLFPLVDSLFPQLTKIFEELNKHATPESAEMQLLLVKTFWSTVNMGVPPFLQNNDNLLPWMNSMMNLLQMQLPPEAKASEVWWKLKKWVSQTFSRLFVRYCNLKDAPSAEGKLFSKNFNAIYAPKLLEAFVNLLGQKKGGSYLSDRVVHSAIGFLDSALRNPNMYRMLKPHLDNMFREIIFPVICFNAKDQELWNEDPQEYLRKEFDIMEEFYHPRSAALAFTCNLVRLRGKSHFLPVMAFTAQVLQKYAAAPPQEKNPAEKDGALQTIGNLPEKILSSKEMEAQVEAMIITHVIPEFTSPFGFLRARCCWLMAQFYELEWKNQPAFLTALRSVISCLKDKELPVRVRAALSLRHLIQNDLAREEVRQILPQLLEAFFSLMNEIDNDELVNTLDIIIERYRDEMEPYAVVLCKKLSEMILRILSESENDNDDNEEDSAITVFESLSAIQTILDAVSDKPHLYVEIEKILYPIMVKLANPDASDFFEEGMKLISFITCFAPTITPEMWFFFKHLYDLFDKHGIEIVSELLIPYDNFINRGTQYFLQSNYITYVFDIIKRVLTSENALETQCGDACKLIEVVLHNLRGHVDNLVEPFLQLAISKFNTAKTNSLKVLLLDVVMNSAYYNPALFLNILEAKGWTQATFNVWFRMIPTLPRILDKKICILGLSALLALPFDPLPALVKQGYLQLIKAAIQVNKDLYKQREEQEKEQDEDVDDDILGSKIEDAEIDENEEAAEEEQQLQQLAEEVQKAYQDYEQDDDDAGGLDDFDDEELEDEDDYTTPIDDVDELVLFTDAMNAIGTNAVLYQSVMSQLEPQAQVDLKDIFEWAEKRKVELANQKQNQNKTS